MKYDADIHSDDANTSHHLVLELVRSGKRVLDIGCSTGYLAAALNASGNVVSGVEVDPEAAEKARPQLDRLVVGDVEHLDLVKEFGEGSFDVVVFADVLEHLKDPVAALRGVAPLLSPGGCVVASIPNVAHGAVRLALLQGRFEYQDLGLLDDTHLRFFTRTSVDELLDAAGYVAADMRRTTAEIFDTEIPLSRSEVPGDVLEQVAQDPESTTYQFVVRALPIMAAVHDESILVSLADRNREVEVLRRQLSDIARALAGTPNAPVIGLLDGHGGSMPAALSGISVAVILAELRRRLGGFEIRCFLLDDDAGGVGLGEEAAVPLLPWDGHRMQQTLSEVDAMVVCGELGGADPHTVIGDLSKGGMAVQFVDTNHKSPDAPQPLALARRLLDRVILDQRAEYLRILGLVPESGGFVLTYLTDSELGDRSAGSGAWQDTARRSGLSVLDVTQEMAPVDLVALVTAAQAVVTDSAPLAALATAFGRPVIAGCPEEVDALVEGALATAPEASLDQGLELAADRYLDEVAGVLVSAAGHRLAQTVPSRLAELTARAAALETVNAALRQTLVRERVALTARVRHVYPEFDAAGLADRPEPLHLKDELRHAETQIQHLQAEIGRIYATRTMRALRPVRRIYGGLRSMLR